MLSLISDETAASSDNPLGFFSFLGWIRTPNHLICERHWPENRALRVIWRKMTIRFCFHRRDTLKNYPYPGLRGPWCRPSATARSRSSEPRRCWRRRPSCRRSATTRRRSVGRRRRRTPTSRASTRRCRPWTPPPLRWWVKTFCLFTALKVYKEV